jgi:hypothetical protein
MDVKLEEIQRQMLNQIIMNRDPGRSQYRRLYVYRLSAISPDGNPFIESSVSIAHSTHFIIMSPNHQQ